MRPILFAALFALPVAAMAQTATPRVSNPTAGPSSTPAPVPAVPPGTPQTGVHTAPPELMAPSGTQNPADRSMSGTAPFSGTPPGAGRNQSTPHGSTADTPALSR